MVARACFQVPSVPIAEPSTASTAATAALTAATVPLTSPESPAAARTAAERAATTRTASSFDGATKRTPARSERAKASVSLWTPQYAFSAKPAGASSTRPSSRNFWAYVNRDISAAAALSGFIVLLVIGSTGPNSRAQAGDDQPRDPPRAFGVLRLPDAAHRAEHVLRVHVGAHRAGRDGRGQELRDRPADLRRGLRAHVRARCREAVQR